MLNIDFNIMSGLDKAYAVRAILKFGALIMSLKRKCYSNLGCPKKEYMTLRFGFESHYLSGRFK